MCLKNLVKTNHYVAFDYVTQEAEQCPVKFMEMRSEAHLTGASIDNPNASPLAGDPFLTIFFSVDFKAIGVYTKDIYDKEG